MILAAKNALESYHPEHLVCSVLLCYVIIFAMSLASFRLEKFFTLNRVLIHFPPSRLTLMQH